MNRPKAIIFDWHGVLDNVEFEGLAKLLAAATKTNLQTMREKLRNIERQYARGDIKPEAFWDEVRTSLSLSHDQLVEARTYIVSTDLKEDVWRLLPALSKEYKLAILSDCPKDKMDYIRRTIDLSLFEVANFSAEEHLLKSDSSFFENVVNKLNLKPQDCLFIDDRAKNLKLPRELGLKVHLFDGSLTIFDTLLA